MKYIIDRIEGEFAVCEKEDLSIQNIPLSVLPEKAKEGSVIILDETGIYHIDLNDEERRRKRILEKQRNLFN